MTVEELVKKLKLDIFLMSEPEREVKGGYCGDLLSWVMGRAAADAVWFTIMSNVNVAAVAALSDVACVVLTESVKPDAGLLEKGKMQGLNLFGTDSGTFEAAAELSRVLGL